MTETRAELIDRGWRLGGGRSSIAAFLADLQIVYEMHCQKCDDPPAKGGLRHETWQQRGQFDKCFTVCRKCGHRKPF